MSKAVLSRQTDEPENEPTFSGISKVLWDADDVEEARELAAERRRGGDD